jgi:hypothetical protein
MTGQNLSRLLLKLFSKGELSGAQVWDLASAAYADGWGQGDSLARRLVSTGSAGRKRSHIARDIIKVAEAEGLVSSKAQPYEFNIATGGTCSIFLPHEFYQAITEGGDVSQWCLSPEIVAGQQGLAALLREWADDMSVQFAGDLSSVGVLGLHCDGVQYTSTMRAGGAKSILVGSLNVISAASAELRYKRQPLFVLRKKRLCQCGCQGFHTIQQIMEVVAWSFGHLASGVAPSHRHDGSPWTTKDQVARLPSGQPLRRAALLQVRGDWEWLEQCFRFRSVNSESFCWMCEAVQRVQSPLDYKDFRPDAPHRATLISHQQYMVRCAQEGSQPSHLFHCPGFKIDHVAVDAMHSGDLGTFADAVGSIFWLECTHKPWHRTQAAGLLSLNQDLENYYGAQPDRQFSKLSPIVWSQIMSKSVGYPFLKAKAAQTRQVAEFCLALALRHQNGDGHRRPFAFAAGSRLAAHTQRHCDLLVSMFAGFLQFTTSCSASPFVHDDCRQGMYKYLMSLGELNTMWREGLTEQQQASMPFHLRPKAHACQHIVEEKTALFGSPNAFWCYRDEDFIGTVKLIAQKTKFPHTIELRIIEKLRIWAALEKF